jgi:hypothetical protein
MKVVQEQQSGDEVVLQQTPDLCLAVGLLAQPGQ